MGACVQHFESWKENTVYRILAGYNSPLKSTVVCGIAFELCPPCLLWERRNLSYHHGKWSATGGYNAW